MEMNTNTKIKTTDAMTVEAELRDIISVYFRGRFSFETQGHPRRLDLCDYGEKGKVAEDEILLTLCVRFRWHHLVIGRMTIGRHFFLLFCTKAEAGWIIMLFCLRACWLYCKYGLENLYDLRAGGWTALWRYLEWFSYKSSSVCGGLSHGARVVGGGCVYGEGMGGCGG